MKISRIILGFFAGIAIMFEWYLGIFSLVGFFIQVILVTSVASLIVYFMTSRQRAYRDIFFQGMYTLMGIIGILVSLFGGFFVYHTVFPAPLSDVYLSDSSGSVVFVSMSHIATPEFFGDKHTQIQSLARDGYTILVEWVRPGTPEHHAQFDAYMGFQFTETLYDTIAALTGLEAQDNDTLYLWVSTGSLVSVDISIDDIVSLIGTGASSVSGAVLDIETELSWATQMLSSRERGMIGYMFRGFLNWSLKNSWDIEAALMEGDRARVFDAIIDKRNKPIIEYIRNHPGKKIAIVYGALHFNGIYAWLQESDPEWKILSIEHSYPYK